MEGRKSGINTQSAMMVISGSGTPWAHIKKHPYFKAIFFFTFHFMSPCKLQALVHNLFPATTALTGYATGRRNGAQMVVCL